MDTSTRRAATTSGQKCFSLETRRLSGRGQDCMPPAAVGIEALALAAEQVDRHVNEFLVQKPDDQPGLTRHCRVHGMSREKVAHDRVGAVCGPAADQVTRIEVA